jgi:hypothetical protein
VPQDPVVAKLIDILRAAHFHIDFRTGFRGTMADQAE